jgi:hypothetical protein
VTNYRDTLDAGEELKIPDLINASFQLADDATPVMQRIAKVQTDELRRFEPGLVLSASFSFAAYLIGKFFTAFATQLGKNAADKLLKNATKPGSQPREVIRYLNNLQEGGRELRVPFKTNAELQVALNEGLVKVESDLVDLGLSETDARLLRRKLETVVVLEISI